MIAEIICPASRMERHHHPLDPTSHMYGMCVVSNRIDVDAYEYSVKNYCWSHDSADLKEDNIFKESKLKIARHRTIFPMATVKQLLFKGYYFMNLVQENIETIEKCIKKKKVQEN